MNPDNWLIVSGFIAIATILSVGYGWLITTGKISLNPVMAYSDAQFQFIRIWARIAGIIGIIVPIILWIVFWDKPTVRVFLNCYLLAIIVQLASEIGFSRTLCKSVVVVIGTLYTGFRIWQLWSGLQLITYPQPWLGLLWLVFLFWVANIIMLTTVAIPSIIPKSGDFSLAEEKTD